MPRSQRVQVEKAYPGGVSRFIEDRVTEVFTRLPLGDNYFWRLYLTGRYSRDCCPEYLKPDNFARLKAGLVDRVQTHTTSLLQFLRRAPARISRFVLLDHMDWLSSHCRPILQQQWQALCDVAAPGARVLWRSGGLQCDYVDPLQVRHRHGWQPLGQLLTYQHELAQRLHRQDRVNTYGSFYIADLHAN